MAGASAATATADGVRWAVAPSKFAAEACKGNRQATSGSTGSRIRVSIQGRKVTLLQSDTGVVLVWYGQSYLASTHCFKV